MLKIFYGAGKNLDDYSDEFVKEAGFPDVICDCDVKKQGKKYELGGGGGKYLRPRGCFTRHRKL